MDLSEIKGRLDKTFEKYHLEMLEYSDEHKKDIEGHDDVVDLYCRFFRDGIDELYDLKKDCELELRHHLKFGNFKSNTMIFDTSFEIIDSYVPRFQEVIKKTIIIMEKTALEHQKLLRKELAFS